MVRAIISILFLLAGFTRAESIDFKPGEHIQELDGVMMKQLVFHQGSQEIGYTAPSGWQINGAGRTLTLTPSNSSQAQVVVECIPLPAPQSFTESRLKALRADAAALVPAKAEHVGSLVEKKNDFRVERSEVFESTVTYSFYGQAVQLGVIYIDGGENLLRCRVIAHAADFKNIYSAFRASLFSWNKL